MLSTGNKSILSFIMFRIPLQKCQTQWVAGVLVASATDSTTPRIPKPAATFPFFSAQERYCEVKDHKQQLPSLSSHTSRTSVNAMEKLGQPGSSGVWFGWAQIIEQIDDLFSYLFLTFFVCFPYCNYCIFERAMFPLLGMCFAGLCYSEFFWMCLWGYAKKKKCKIKLYDFPLRYNVKIMIIDLYKNNIYTIVYLSIHLFIFHIFYKMGKYLRV